MMPISAKSSLIQVCPQEEKKTSKTYLWKIHVYAASNSMFLATPKPLLGTQLSGISTGCSVPDVTFLYFTQGGTHRFQFLYLSKQQQHLSYSVFFHSAFLIKPCSTKRSHYTDLNPVLCIQAGAPHAVVSKHSESDIQHFWESASSLHPVRQCVRHGAK